MRSMVERDTRWLIAEARSIRTSFQPPAPPSPPPFGRPPLPAGRRRSLKFMQAGDNLATRSRATQRRAIASGATPRPRLRRTPRQRAGGRKDSPSPEGGPPAAGCPVGLRDASAGHDQSGYSTHRLALRPSANVSGVFSSSRAPLRGAPSGRALCRRVPVLKPVVTSNPRSWGCRTGRDE